MKTKTSYCLECKEEIQGRADKKYCSDACRVAHHNQRRIIESRSLRAVNLILSRNRSILLDCLEDKTSDVELMSHQLSLKGFDFSFCTHRTTDEKGKPIHYCYDVGYRMLNPSRVLITRRT
jgi:hypothetical protein